MSTCKSCLAPITWVRMLGTDKAMPVDREPHDEGTVVLTGGSRRGSPLARVVRSDEHVHGMRYRSHFVSCPNAKAHRQ